MPPNLVCIPPADVRHIWPHVRGFVEAAIERNELSSFASIEDSILSGRSLLWVVWDGQTTLGAVATKVDDTEWGRFCTLLAFGGDLKASLPLLEVIEDYAHAIECKELRAVGPEAWLRILPADYHKTAVVIAKVL